MLNKLLLTTLIGVGSLLASPIFAADTSAPAATKSSDMGKDEWLQKLKELVPAMICKNFMDDKGLNKQLTTANINYDKCVTLIPASFDKCQAKFYSQLPTTIGNENADQWGRKIGECIGTDFATLYLTGVPQETSATSEKSTSTSTASADTIPKDVWLGKLKDAVPALICKGFLQDDSLSKTMQKVNINYDKCVTLIPASVDKCQKELYPNIPATINEDSAGKWGNTLGECIGKDFAVKYLL